MAVFEQSVAAGVGLLHDGLGIAHEARQQPCDRLKHYRHGHFAAVEHVVANRILSHVDALRTIMIGDAGIVALVAAASEDQPIGVRKLGGVALGE